MTDKATEIEALSSEIHRLLRELEGYFWDVFVEPGYYSGTPTRFEQAERDDKETWLFHGTRRLYYLICLFFELKGAPIYLNQFISKFGGIINDKSKVMQNRGPLFDESEPSMIIHDDFRDFLSGFSEFDNKLKKAPNRLNLILDSTNIIIDKSKIKITNEASVYNAIRWYLEIIYPTTRARNNARFIKQFNTYKPDILIPELNSAIEYKLVKNGKTPGVYLDQIKTDADNYTGDPEYKYFYAVVFFENKIDINRAVFMNAIKEKSFPDNWVISAL